MVKWAALLCLALGCGLAPAAQPRPLLPPPGERSGSHREVERAASEIALGLAFRGAFGLLDHKQSSAARAHMLARLGELIESEKRPVPGVPFPDPLGRPFAQPAVREARDIVLEPGTRAVVQHEIDWRNYPGDELEVTVTASDPALTVPGKLLLTYEKHRNRFEYEILAGDEPGDYTVTLKPASGPAVVVRVTVR